MIDHRIAKEDLARTGTVMENCGELAIEKESLVNQQIENN
jgi:hypothetical protein